MTLPRDPAEGEGKCAPGDITVSHVPAGYLIGRVLPRLGLGPWWSYLALVPAYEEAVREARCIAANNGVRAWLHKGGEVFELLDE